MPRNYTPKGGNGGRRPGAGRPATRAALEYGESSAIRAIRRRVPPNATEAEAQLAGEALETIVRVMRGDIEGPDAPNRRNAAKDVREEICGTFKQQVEHSLPELSDEELHAKLKALLAKGLPGAGQQAQAAEKGADLGPGEDA